MTKPKPDIFGFQLSDNYELLWRLIWRGHRIPGWLPCRFSTDKGLEPPIVWDIVEIKVRNNQYMIGYRGQGYEGMDQDLEQFKWICEQHPLWFAIPALRCPPSISTQFTQVSCEGAAMIALYLNTKWSGGLISPERILTGLSIIQIESLEGELLQQQLIKRVDRFFCPQGHHIARDEDESSEEYRQRLMGDGWIDCEECMIPYSSEEIEHRRYWKIINNSRESNYA